MELEKYKEALAVFDHDYSKENAFTPFFRWYSALINIKIKTNQKQLNF